MLKAVAAAEVLFRCKMICKVYQCGNKNDSLLLVDPSDWVINGDWPLSYAKKHNLPIALVGHIDKPYCENYNKTINRFIDGERMIADQCQCCGTVKKWQKVNENASSTRHSGEEKSTP